MVAFVLNFVVTILSLAPNHYPKYWLAPLPPPPALMRAEIISRQLITYRRVLSDTESLRKHYESLGDMRDDYIISKLIAREADCKRRILELEELVRIPPSRMPVLGGASRVPKPPIRD